LFAFCGQTERQMCTIISSLKVTLFRSGD